MPFQSMVIADVLNWSERFPGYGWIEVSGMMVVGFAIGGLFGVVGSKGALLRRDVTEHMRRRLPACLRFAYLSHYSNPKNKENNSDQRRSAEMNAFVSLMFLQIAWEAIFWRPFENTAIDVDFAIMLQFTWILPQIVGFFIVLWLVEYWLVNKWYPSVRTTHEYQYKPEINNQRRD